MKAEYDPDVGRRSGLGGTAGQGSPAHPVGADVWRVRLGACAGERASAPK
ncbi:MAG: hypothetical protein ACUVTZ_02710 [Armatimonadota bacterium]